MAEVLLKTIKCLKDFFCLEAAGGIVLMFASVVALVIANSALYPYYDHVLNDIHVGFGLPESVGFHFYVEHSVLEWINDALMVIFFLLVALEIKYELVEGALSSVRKAILPAAAAAGGMAIPALVYWFINRDSPDTIQGWAIPCATDIAFAVGVLALLGKRIPMSLKVLLLAAAIIDDLGAIVIIALFYSDELRHIPLMLTLIPLTALFIMNRMQVGVMWPYMLAGVLLWLAVLESGIHATVAGVVLAFFIPTRVPHKHFHSPVRGLQHRLHPWVAFGIMPIFGFANAGVPFDGISFHSLFHPVTLGIILGLFLGKQIGIFLTVTTLVGLKICPKPAGATWFQIYGLSVLFGIGFTMSLFIGSLSFDTVEMQASVRLGVLVGSLISAVLAYMLLRSAPPKQVLKI